MTPKEMIDVIAGFEAGKKVRFRPRGDRYGIRRYKELGRGRRRERIV